MTISIFVIIQYNIITAYYNYKSPDNAIFIWGDSQTANGIEIQKLKSLTQKKIYNAANDGNGVYDFYVFTEIIPKNSTVIVAISKPMQIRLKEWDRNSSGFSISSLYSLYKNNYTFFELLGIIRKNINPVKLFNESTHIFRYNDSIVLTEPISLFTGLHKNIPQYLYDKQNVFLEGILNLKEKNCDLILLEFPYHHILKEIEQNSIVKPLTEKFKLRLLNHFNKWQIDTLKLNGNKQMMHDLTHLNELGASNVSEYIGEKINNRERTIKTLHNSDYGVQLIVIVN